jgi:hypothetical protein
MSASRNSFANDVRSSRDSSVNDTVQQGRQSVAFRRAFCSQNSIISKSISDYEEAQRRSFEVQSRIKKIKKPMVRSDYTYDVVVPAKDMFEHIKRLAYRGNGETLRKYKGPLAALNS